MYTLEKLNSRLDLFEKNFAEWRKIFSRKFTRRNKNYLARDSEFELQVNKTPDKVIADAFSRTD